MKHRVSVHETSEGSAQAVCSCGWRSPVYGTEKTRGTMDALQQATDAADLHEWDASLK